MSEPLCRATPSAWTLMQNSVQVGLHFLTCCSWICTTLCSWVCTTLWVCSWVCNLPPCTEAPWWCADDAHYCTILSSWVFHFWLCKIKFRNSVQWIALPVCWRCTPVNQWKKSAKNLKWIICRSKSARVQNKRSCQPNNTLRSSLPLPLSLRAGRRISAPSITCCWSE